MLTTDFVFFKRCIFNILHCKIGICINFEYKGLFPFLFGHWTSSCACVSFFYVISATRELSTSFPLDFNHKHGPGCYVSKVCKTYLKLITYILYTANSNRNKL